MHTKHYFYCLYYLMVYFGNENKEAKLFLRNKGGSAAAKDSTHAATQRFAAKARRK